MESQPRELRYYITENGECPFTEWLASLRDRRARTKIEVRLERVELGNFGDCKSVGTEVYELRIDTGAGYRIYFGQVGTAIVLLLCGRDKSAQDKDIQTAKLYWRNYESSQDRSE